MRTALIWSNTLKVSLILFALNSLKLSAQSPPCKRKALPRAASANFSSRCLASPAKTIGGKLSMVLSTDSRSFLSGYSGNCSAFFNFQLSTLHFTVWAGTEGEAGLAFSVTVGFLDGSAACTAEMEAERRRRATGSTEGEGVLREEQEREWDGWGWVWREVAAWLGSAIVGECCSPRRLPLASFGFWALSLCAINGFGLVMREGPWERENGRGKEMEFIAKWRGWCGWRRGCGSWTGRKKGAHFMHTPLNYWDFNYMDGHPDFKLWNIKIKVAFFNFFFFSFGKLTNIVVRLMKKSN